MSYILYNPLKANLPENHPVYLFRGLKLDDGVKLELHPTQDDGVKLELHPTQVKMKNLVSKLPLWKAIKKRVLITIYLSSSAVAAIVHIILSMKMELFGIPDLNSMFTLFNCTRLLFHIG